MRRVLAGLLLVAALGAARAEDAGVLTPRSDSYDVTWKGMAVGRGTITLTALDANCYRFRSTTRPMALVRWLYGAPSETSEFCVDQGHIVPRHFSYVLDDGAKDNFTLDFDAARQTVKTIKGSDVRLRELTGTAYDRFVLQLVIRQWVAQHAADAQPPTGEFSMVDDRRIQTYRFAIVGREAVTTPAGAFDAVRVDRVDNPRKSSRFWLAPERAWAPVRIEEIEKGQQKVLMQLVR